MKCVSGDAASRLSRGIYITRLTLALLLLFLVFLVVTDHLVELVNHFLKERHDCNRLTSRFSYQSNRKRKKKKRNENYGRG